MKFKITKRDKKYSVWMYQDQQAFLFGYKGTKKDCEWYVKMLKKAFERHDKVVLSKAGINEK